MAQVFLSSDQVSDLLAWLRAEEIDGLVVRKAPGTPRAGEMGFDASMLEVLVDAPAMAALAGSLGIWLRSRRSRVKVELEVGGRKVKIDSTNIDDADKVLLEALRSSE